MVKKSRFIFVSLASLFLRYPHLIIGCHSYEIAEERLLSLTSIVLFSWNMIEVTVFTTGRPHEIVRHVLKTQLSHDLEGFSIRIIAYVADSR